MNRIKNLKSLVESKESQKNEGDIATALGLMAMVGSLTLLQSWGLKFPEGFNEAMVDVKKQVSEKATGSGAVTISFKGKNVASFKNVKGFLSGGLIMGTLLEKRDVIAMGSTTLALMDLGFKPGEELEITQG